MNKNNNYLFPISKGVGGGGCTGLGLRISLFYHIFWDYRGVYIFTELKTLAQFLRYDFEIINLYGKMSQESHSSECLGKFFFQ
jgi:hypothetical protein